MATPALEEYYNRIIQLPRVVGFLVITLDGVAIKSTLGPAQTLKYAGQVAPLIEKTRKMIRELVVEEEENAVDDVCFMRLRTTFNEVLIAPDHDYAMIVIQMPTDKVEEEDEGEGEAERGGEKAKTKEVEVEETDDFFP